MPTIKKLLIDDYGVVIKDNSYELKLWDNDKGYLFKPSANYIKGYQGIKLSNILQNKADYANMHLLAECLYKDTNMISVYCNHHYRPADIDDMESVTGLNERHTKEFINRMIIIGVIAKVNILCNECLVTQYHVNPLYFTTNKYLSPALYMMFKKQLDGVLKPWIIARFNNKE